MRIKSKKYKTEEKEDMEGYAKIANVMALHPELAIFRRFGVLNMQRALHLQAELMHLEEELERQVAVDLAENPLYAKDWWSLSRSSDNGDEKQLRKLFEVGAKLKEYS
jgi:hypothetical protein